ncbi:hypothetical protein OO006_04000 [Prosthecochloris sp. SCSIO W1101]|uniref:hypothetical protein n=1 Tax=Prosthecochloris sp. SCSIO W1101 TaxID=2992242 RepID=UPI00223D7F02|nr:hypothetical protein [Prosthecochloris sp. SCSIO W1101]UZJ42153.1 hypothetical protein OO006_04000 [Prosthecochloris sp. SCSIO W1101]
MAGGELDPLPLTKGETICRHFGIEIEALDALSDIRAAHEILTKRHKQSKALQKNGNWNKKKAAVLTAFLEQASPIPPAQPHGREVVNFILLFLYMQSVCQNKKT